MDVPFIITTLLAIWGAVISTILLVREFAKDKRNVTVTCQMGTPWPPFVGRRFIPQDLVLITAVNAGHRPVQITSLGFKLSSDRQMVAIQDAYDNTTLPKVLSEGDSVTMSYSFDEVAAEVQTERQRYPEAQIKLLHAFAKDSTGNVWTCSMPQVLIDRGLA